MTVATFLHRFGLASEFATARLALIALLPIRSVVPSFVVFGFRSTQQVEGGHSRFARGNRRRHLPPSAAAEGIILGGLEKSKPLCHVGLPGPDEDGPVKGRRRHSTAIAAVSWRAVFARPDGNGSCQSPRLPAKGVKAEAPRGSSTLIATGTSPRSVGMASGMQRIRGTGTYARDRVLAAAVRRVPPEAPVPLLPGADCMAIGAWNQAIGTSS